MPTVEVSVSAAASGDGLVDTLRFLSEVRELTLRVDEGVRREGLRPPASGISITMSAELIDVLILNLETAREQRDCQPTTGRTLLAIVVGAIALAVVFGVAWLLAVPS